MWDSISCRAYLTGQTGATSWPLPGQLYLPPNIRSTRIGSKAHLHGMQNASVRMLLLKWTAEGDTFRTHVLVNNGDVNWYWNYLSNLPAGVTEVAYDIGKD